MEMKIKLSDLHPDPQNLRESVDGDTGAWKELVQSVRSMGILEPLIVRKRTDGGYWIVAGHRRHAAALEAGITETDCVVRDITDDEVTEMQLIENLMRVDINPIEEASGYFRLVERGMGRKALAERIGRSAAHIGHRMKLLELDTRVQACVKANQITATDAALLAGFDGEELDDLLTVAKDHGNVKWRVERATETRLRRQEMQQVIDRARDATGFDPVVMTRHEWNGGDYKSWRDLSDLCTADQIQTHREQFPDIHQVVIFDNQTEWFEATTNVTVTRKALDLPSTLSDADLAEREQKRTEREHKAARMLAMQSAVKGSRLPVTRESLAATVSVRYLNAVHQEVRKTAGQILGLDPEESPDDQWFPTATLEQLMTSSKADADRVALALTMAQDALRADKADSLDEELADWGLLHG